MSSCSSLLARARTVCQARASCSSPSFLSTRRHLSKSQWDSPENLAMLQTIMANKSTKSDYPDLMKPDVLYDSVHTRYFRGRRQRRLTKVNLLNDPSYVAVDKELNDMLKARGNEGVYEELDSNILVNKRRHLAKHKYHLITRRVTQQTGKGRRHRMYDLVVVGNGDGLVGYGEGKHEELAHARRLAENEALRSMDAVERFEGRTIWTDMSIKFGATRILMRPRPVGFGLHCNPNIHQVLKAAGIKDVSAKVWGSRNPMNVIKATCMLIQAGHAPHSMGDGIGGKGRRLDAGEGMRSKEVVERERGRKIVDGRT